MHGCPRNLPATAGGSNRLEPSRLGGAAIFACSPGLMRAATIIALLGIFLATPLDPQPCSGSKSEQCEHAPLCGRYIMLQQRPAWEMRACAKGTAGTAAGMCVEDPVIDLWRDAAFMEFLGSCEDVAIRRCEAAGTCCDYPAHPGAHWAHPRC